MAKSTYISENLNQIQRDFLILLDENEIDIFTLDDVKKIIPSNKENANEIIENLIHKKMISRIERGKYCKVNFRDEKVIACFLVPDGVLSYWTALNLHGLTEQFSNTLFVQTTKSKRDNDVFGVKYQFIKIGKSKRQGITKGGFGNYAYSITNVEKTIVDCFDLPQYSGGYAELIRAFHQAKLSSEKMIEYCKAINNIAATKRMGYLAELFNKAGMKAFIHFAKQQVKEAYNPFDPQGLDSGEFNKEWKLRLNISKEDILNISNKLY